VKQISMTGEDWISDRDRKAQTKAKAARAKAALKAAKALQDAAEAVSDFAMACLECNDESSPRRDDDSRYRLTSDIRDYASWLERVYL
jgi:hypothetical protein